MVIKFRKAEFSAFCVDRLTVCVQSHVANRVSKECGMPTGPRGEKRPADVIGCAVMVARLSVGDEEECTTAPSGRVRSGMAGAMARAEKLSKEDRTKIAQKAAAVRWG